MAQSASTTSSVTGRYVNALFELALLEKAVESVDADLERFQGLIDGSEDLRRLINSPVFSGEEQFAAVDKLLDKAKIGGLVGNFVRVTASNRRLFIMPKALAAYRKLAAAHRGEVTAEMTVAKALTAQQTKELSAALKSVVGKDVAIESSVDPSLLGGMIVKVGSRQIDTSLKTKLSSLKLTLKEVG